MEGRQLRYNYVIVQLTKTNVIIVRTTSTIFILKEKKNENIKNCRRQNKSFSSGVQTCIAIENFQIIAND